MGRDSANSIVQTKNCQDSCLKIVHYVLIGYLLIGAACGVKPVCRNGDTQSRSLTQSELSSALGGSFEYPQKRRLRFAVRFAACG